MAWPTKIFYLIPWVTLKSFGIATNNQLNKNTLCSKGLRKNLTKLHTTRSHKNGTFFWPFKSINSLLVWGWALPQKNRAVIINIEFSFQVMSSDIKVFFLLFPK